MKNDNFQFKTEKRTLSCSGTHSSVFPPGLRFSYGKELIDRLEQKQTLTREEWTALIQGRTPELAEYLFEKARTVRIRHYGHDIYIRGLIEFTNYCRNDCCYCGIRKSNRNAVRYRLTKDQILSCCRKGYQLGFRTFVLQGGEDRWYTPERMTDIIAEIHASWPDCAITLSIGELSREEYLQYFEAGADRFLLRHETFDAGHYGRLHPPGMTAVHRQKCLWDLKEIGYQVGTGFMVGSPYQTAENLADDMLFLKKLNPQMVGIGPFIPHHDTPFANEPAGTAELTLFMLGLIRLMIPRVLLPATTALGTILPDGREKGILAGANVVMPNLSPPQVRENYLLYDNKLCTGDEAAESLNNLAQRMESIGCQIAVSRGDSLNSRL